LEDLSDAVLQKYPKARKYKDRIYNLRIPLTEDVDLSINFKKYPRPPKILLLKNNGRKFKLGNILTYLRDWNDNNPYPIVNVVDEVVLIIESILNRQIPFTESCFEGLIEMAKKYHPQKVQGVLSVNKGKVSDLIIPAIKCANPSYANRINYVNFQPFCQLPFDFSYEGTFISRPNGDLSKNEAFNVVMRKRRFTMLLAYPYDKPECVRIVDRDGNDLKYAIYSDE
jgi:hypothetical protein